MIPSVAAASGDQDGLPVTLLEAMALGCAVVASRLSGIDAAVVDGESGLLVPPGDAGALAAALEALLADPDPPGQARRGGPVPGRGVLRRRVRRPLPRVAPGRRRRRMGGEASRAPAGGTDLAPQPT